MSTVETLPPPPARPNASPCAVHGCGDAADVRLSWPLVHPETRQTLSPRHARVRHLLPRLPPARCGVSRATWLAAQAQTLTEDDRLELMERICAGMQLYDWASAIAATRESRTQRPRSVAKGSKDHAR